MLMPKNTVLIKYKYIQCVLTLSLIQTHKNIYSEKKTSLLSFVEKIENV